jgi:RNA polymerase sigma-54 factor
MRQGLRANIRVETGLRVDPRVVLSSQILQLTTQELEQAIETELNENPALERLQDDFEPVNEEAILKAVAPHELRPSSEDQEFRRSLPNDDSAPDWVDLTASSTSMLEHLRAQLLPMLEKQLRGLGEYLIESVSDKGYLDVSLEEAALAAGASLEEAEDVLAKLQQCEPAGVGARDLKECLLLQLRDAKSLEEQLARAVIKSHMDDFVARRTGKISRRYKVLPAVVEASFDVILALNPFPGEGFHCGMHLAHHSRSFGITPDLKLSRTDQGWDIEIKGAEPTSLCINRAYDLKYQAAQNGGRMEADEKRHVSTYVQRANDFISSLQQRRRTLRKIGEYLVQNQTSFVTTGSYQFLRSLTRSQMAKELELHESTVSRATMGKFVQLATGDVVTFDVFFKPALRVQKMIEEILRGEDSEKPYSDEQIARMLARKGVEVARRTVNKYRDRTKLLSSRKRRSA